MAMRIFLFVLLIVTWPIFGHSQSTVPPNINLQTYKPSTEPQGVFSTSGSEVSGHLNVYSGLEIDWMRKPLRLTIADQGVALGDVLSHRIESHVVSSIGLGLLTQVGLHVSGVCFQEGANNEVVQRIMGLGNVAMTGISDLSLFAKYQLWPTIALGGRVLAPTGDPSRLAGEPSWAMTPLIMMSYYLGPHRLLAEVGYLWRHRAMQLGKLQINDEVLYQLGFSIRLKSRPKGLSSALLFEIAGRTPRESPWGLKRSKADITQNTLETRAGLRIPIRTGWGIIRLSFGGGVGVLPGYSSPFPRVLVGLAYLQQAPKGDRDRDRIVNNRDACPRVAEDFDDFEDTDGCPERDNDGDGILDEDDECPFESEDKDGIEDMDGCIDHNVLDRDGDGVYEPDDKCPEEKEDKDGFEDTDGCPDIDNDGDKLSDLGDMCPDAAEDYNGFQDDDGCPDIKDAPQYVELGKQQIKLHRPFKFVRHQIGLRKESEILLLQIAMLLRSHPELQKIQIEAFPERPHRRSSLLALRRANNIVNGLVSLGIANQRLSEKSMRWYPKKAGQIQITILQRSLQQN